MLEFSSRLFWRHEKAFSFGYEKFSFSERHNTKSLLWRNKKAISFQFGIFVFEGAKKQKIASKLLWFHEMAICFGFGKFGFPGLAKRKSLHFFFSSDKTIRHRFGKFNFSGRQNACSPVNVVLVA
jgi:hypothetical protein